MSAIAVLIALLAFGAPHTLHTLASESGFPAVKPPRQIFSIHIIMKQ